MAYLPAFAIVLAVLAPFSAWYLWERGKRYTEAMPGGLCTEFTVDHEEEFELYHNALSLCSKKLRVCLDELGIPYRRHHIDLIETGRYENIGSAFLAVNPGGTLPVLVHNGHPVYESHEQIRYAADRAPLGGPELVPIDAQTESTMQVWVDCASIVGDNPIDNADKTAGCAIPGLTVPLFASMIEGVSYSNILEGLLFHRLRQRPLAFLALKFTGLARLDKLKPAMRIVRSCVRHMHTHLDALELQLERSGGPWITGPQFTLADVSWIPIFERLRECDYEALYLGDGRRPLTRAYWQRLRGRASYASAIANHGHPAIERGLARLRQAKRDRPALAQALEGR